ncbi:MAG TPA: signal peptidase I [Actinomycetota bacterium]|nr:signal peptidase I [Actinomycetota bacterium]
MTKVAKVFGILVVVASMAAAWFFLAPRGVGGPISYVVTDGVSMQPRLHAGDLVLLREAPSYGVGDIAGYRSHSLDRVVLHRIVDETADGRFLFKGDNNDFIDQDHPTAADLLGAKWVIVPGGGKVFNWVGQPLHAAVLASLVVLLLGWGLFAPSRRRRRNARHEMPRRSGRAPSGRAPSGRPSPGFTTIAVVIGTCSLLVGAVAWTHAERDVVSKDARFETRGAFSYSASVDKSSVYQDGKVTTGEPLFLKLADEVTVRFDYSVVAAEDRDVTGDGSLMLTLSDPNGWSYVQRLDGTTTDTADGGSLEGVVNLAKVRAVLARFTKLTELQQAAYSLTIQPRLHLSGAVAGQPIDQEFAPQLAFDLDQFRARLKTPGVDPNTGLASGDQLHPVVPGTVQIPEVVPGVVALGPFRLPVAGTRTGALFGLLVALLFAFAGLRSRPITDEADAITRRYGPFLVDASSASPPVESRVIGVRTMDELARVAARYERFIVHEEENGIHTYSVADDGIVYWYQVMSDDVAEPGTIEDVTELRRHRVATVVDLPASRG